MRHWNGGYGPGSQHMMGYGNFSFVLIIIISVILLIMLFLIYKLFQKNKESTTSSRIESTDAALNILKERYASGEITDEEYERMKKVIEDR